MRYLMFIAGIFCILTFFSVNVNAAPQIIFYSVNLSIEITTGNLTYHVWGEGFDAREVLPLSITNETNLTTWTFSHNRNGIPATFSRDVCENLDTAVLIKTLANTNNLSTLWVECMKMKENCTRDLAMCQTDIGYKGNYTEAKSQYDTCMNSLNSKGTEISSKDSEIKTLKSHRLALGAGMLIVVITAYRIWRKNTPKTLASPGLSQLPRSQKM